MNKSLTTNTYIFLDKNNKKLAIEKSKEFSVNKHIYTEDEIKELTGNLFNQKFSELLKLNTIVEFIPEHIENRDKYIKEFISFFVNDLNYLITEQRVILKDTIVLGYREIENQEEKLILKKLNKPISLSNKTGVYKHKSKNIYARILNDKSLFIEIYFEESPDRDLIKELKPEDFEDCIYQYKINNINEILTSPFSLLDKNEYSKKKPEVYMVCKDPFFTLIEIFPNTRNVRILKKTDKFYFLSNGQVHLIPKKRTNSQGIYLRDKEIIKKLLRRKPYFEYKRYAIF